MVGRSGGITARTLDYLELFVAASVWALCSAVVATICVRFEERGQAWFWAAAFFTCVLTAEYCLEKVL